MSDEIRIVRIRKKLAEAVSAKILTEKDAIILLKAYLVSCGITPDAEYRLRTTRDRRLMLEPVRNKAPFTEKKKSQNTSLFPRLPSNKFSN
jgi:hypothetical protein